MPNHVFLRVNVFKVFVRVWVCMCVYRFVCVCVRVLCEGIGGEGLITAFRPGLCYVTAFYTSLHI